MVRIRKSPSATLSAREASRQQPNNSSMRTSRHQVNAPLKEALMVDALLNIGEVGRQRKPK